MFHALLSLDLRTQKLVHKSTPSGELTRHSALNQQALIQRPWNFCWFPAAGTTSLLDGTGSIVDGTGSQWIESHSTHVFPVEGCNATGICRDALLTQPETIDASRSARASKC